MAGFVVVPAVSPARSPLRASQWVVLMAVALGLVFGAMVCAAGLAGGVAHGAPQPSVVEVDRPAVTHADHAALIAERGSHPTQPGDHGDHSGNTSMAGSHPGMACVVSVDLHFPDADPVSISDSSEIPLMAMSTGCPADVDPPVPRFS